MSWKSVVQSWGIVPERSQIRAAYYRARYPRATIGPGFRVTRRLTITGPGRVIIGANCLVTTAGFTTLDPDARITVGDDCYLNGTGFLSKVSITVGDRCEISDTAFFDTDFHSTQRRPRGTVKSAPVVVGDDVWLAARTAVLRGARVGDRSVVGFGTVVTGEVPPDHLVHSASNEFVPLSDRGHAPVEDSLRPGR